MQINGILAAAPHTNVVAASPRRDAATGSVVALVMPFARHATLWEAMTQAVIAGRANNPAFRRSMAFEVGLQLLAAEAHIHDVALVSHQDIKPENILLGELDLTSGFSTHLAIADFGLAALVGSQLVTGAGTPMVCAPEQVTCCPSAPTLVDGAADVYAAGVLLVRVLRPGMPVAYGCSDKQRWESEVRAGTAHVQDVDAAVDWLPHATKTALGDLLKSMLAFRPASRPRASEAHAQLASIARAARHS